jgi:hypothetical protein
LIHLVRFSWIPLKESMNWQLHRRDGVWFAAVISCWEAAMMGQRVMAEPLFYRFRIEDHVPEDHLLRAVDQLLDTAFVRKVMAPYYSAIGRPSIDPELMVRVCHIRRASVALAPDSR